MHSFRSMNVSPATVYCPGPTGCATISLPAKAGQLRGISGWSFTVKENGL